MPLKKSLAKKQGYNPRKKRSDQREMGVNDIEIICKLADECRTVKALRDYCVKQIGIYENLLKILDKEFNYDEYYERSCNSDKLDIILRAARRLG